MKTRSFFCLQVAKPKARAAFTLMETVIAIGVLAVLLTGFFAVFTPAAQGIRRSTNFQQADRLASALEREMVTPRKGQKAAGAVTDFPTGFDKAFDWLTKGYDASYAIFVYQYRGDPSNLRDDGTPSPLANIKGLPGADYTIQSIARRAGEDYFAEDLAAIEGSIFYVKPAQLIHNHDNNSILLNPDPGTVKHFVNGTLTGIDDPAVYNEAVLAFSAEFYNMPAKSIKYLNSPKFTERFHTTKKPVFTRNLAVLR